MSPRNVEHEPGNGFFSKIWQYRKFITIEPMLICAILPLGLLSVTTMNFSLEKACRVNLGYDVFICNSLLHKKLNGIDCTKILLRDNTSNIDTNISLPGLDTNLTSSSLNNIVCKAEVESQKIITVVNAIRGPMASIFPIIVILFAGGWSDRNSLRKPILLFPLIGEVLALSAHILSSVFMDTIPMEFGAIIERVVPSMFGGQTLLIMGVLSYLTETTAEEDRAFRFGIFSACLKFAQLIGLSFSGVLHDYLGYVNMFIMGDCFFILAIIYLVFFIPEINSKTDVSDNNTNEVHACNISEWSDMPLESDEKRYRLTLTTKKKRNCLIDFFDPTAAYECIQVFLKKRENNGRVLLILLVILHLLFSAPSERDYIYLYAMKNLKWDGDMYSAFLTYETIILLIGTFLMTGLFIKVFKMSNAMAGLFASILAVLSNIFKAFSSTTVLLYTAISINLFSDCIGIVINAIISGFVDKAELGRMYSVLGITAALCGFVVPLSYGYVYGSTIQTFPGAIYLLSEAFLIPAAILFGIIYVMMKLMKV